MASSFTPSGHGAGPASSSSPYAGEAPPSPEAPPYSPISPVASDLPALPALPLLNTAMASKPAAPAARPQYMAQAPPPEPIDESSNPDAIALRAAISVLQVQRQRALGDLQTLERQRDAAAAHPEEFARALADGKVRARESTSVLGGGDPESDSEDGNEDEDGDEDMDVDGDEAKPKKAKGKKAKDGKKPKDKEKGKDDAEVRFDHIPAPQSIVRCPPINWAKYHVAGEALDRLHQEQQTRPDSGLPHRDPTARPPEHHVAAPYSPWKDKLTDPPPKGRTEARKG